MDLLLMKGTIFIQNRRDQRSARWFIPATAWRSLARARGRSRCPARPAAPGVTRRCGVISRRPKTDAEARHYAPGLQQEAAAARWSMKRLRSRAAVPQNCFQPRDGHAGFRSPANPTAPRARTSRPQLGHPAAVHPRKQRARSRRRRRQAAPRSPVPNRFSGLTERADTDGPRRPGRCRRRPEAWRTTS